MRYLLNAFLALSQPSQELFHLQPSLLPDLYFFCQYLFVLAFLSLKVNHLWQLLVRDIFILLLILDSDVFTLHQLLILLTML